MEVRERIAEIIEEETERFNETLANSLRWAAWLVREELGDSITASQFGDAAEDCGLHRQGATNRWREAMKNWEIAFGDETPAEAFKKIAK